MPKKLTPEQAAAAEVVEATKVAAAKVVTDAIASGDSKAVENAKNAYKAATGKAYRAPKDARPAIIWVRLGDEPKLHKAIYDAAEAEKIAASEYLARLAANALGIEREVKAVDVLKTVAKADRKVLLEAALASFMAANAGKSMEEILASMKSADKS